MPGHVIHIAVAKEYLRKHKKAENEEQFIEGVISPDLTDDKSKTHYGPYSSKTNLKEFLKENNIDTSFKRGYFLHLVTDYLFYNKYLDICTKVIYHDYDVTNRELIQKYNVQIPEKIKDEVFFNDGEPKLLSKELIIKFINEVSKLDLDKIEEEIKNNPNNEKWNTYNYKI